MAVFQTSGTRVYIGPSMTDVEIDYVATDFSALTFIEIGNTTSIGSFGDTNASVTSDEINRGRTRMGKGVKSAGTMTVTCNSNPTDAGQTALAAAELSPNNYGFKVVFNNAATPGGVGSTRYFAAKVMSVPENAGTANNFVTVTFNLAIDSNIVKIAAS